MTSTVTEAGEIFNKVTPKESITYKFDEFQAIIDPICDQIPSCVISPLLAVMRVFFRNRYGLVFTIHPIMYNHQHLRSNFDFQHHKEPVSGSISIGVRKGLAVQKVGSYPYRKRIVVARSNVSIAVEYWIRPHRGYEDSHRKRLTFKSTKFSRDKNKQPKYRKFATSVISSMFKDNAAIATEYVMEQ